RYLMPSVNGEIITKRTMEPVYSIIHTLYTAAAADKVIPDEYIDEQMINVEKVELWRVFKDKVGGKVAFTKVNKDQLKMGVPDNKKSPYDYIDLEKSSDMNPPIVL